MRSIKSITALYRAVANQSVISMAEGCHLQWQAEKIVTMHQEGKITDDFVVAYFAPKIEKVKIPARLLARFGIKTQRRYLMDYAMWSYVDCSLEPVGHPTSAAERRKAKRRR